MTETLPITPDLIHSELESATAILARWTEMVNKGIPGIDLPSADAEEAVERFRRELCGELLIVAGRCQTLSVVLSEG